MATPLSVTSSSRSAPLTRTGWQSGVSSLVRLSAIRPAVRAMPRTSPFSTRPDLTSSAVPLLIETKPEAAARRAVSGFSPTSTMRALPRASKWLSLRPAIGRLALLPLLAGRLGGRAEVELHLDGLAGRQGHRRLDALDLGVLADLGAQPQPARLDRVFAV